VGANEVEGEGKKKLAYTSKGKKHGKKKKGLPSTGEVAKPGANLLEQKKIPFACDALSKGTRLQQEGGGGKRVVPSSERGKRCSLKRREELPLERKLVKETGGGLAFVL